jgi:hypothetical protein
MEQQYKTHTFSERLIYITIFQLWWVSVWGIAYLGVEFLAKGSKIMELIIYFLLLIIIFVVLKNHPNLVIHL